MKKPSKPTISIVMPVYNAERYLIEAIDSILVQDYSDFEFIIINDGSTDQSKQIIHSFNDSRIVYLENDKNLGIVQTLNKGLHAAKGKFIARMDADDISLPHRFKQQINYLSEHPEIGVVGTAYQPIDELANPVRAPIYMPEYPMSAKWFMLIGSPLAHPSIMFYSELARKIGGYSDQFPHAEDYEYWLRMFKITKICSIHDIGLLYRDTNANRVSITFSREQAITTCQIRQMACKQLFNMDMTSDVSESIQDWSKGTKELSHFEACKLLYSCYEDLLDNEECTLPFANLELKNIAKQQILSIASRIQAPSLLFDLFNNPMLFSRMLLFKSIIKTNMYRIKHKLFSTIK
jgi:glycosyltransferase involved in cell wall biosynthesis